MHVMLAGHESLCEHALPGASRGLQDAVVDASAQ